MRLILLCLTLFGCVMEEDDAIADLASRDLAVADLCKNGDMGCH